MRAFQKAGAFALIVGIKCLRQALTTLADIQDAAEGRQSPTGGPAEMQAIRIEMDLMQASLRQIKATLGTETLPAGEHRLLQ
jgi:hypothetical protein